MYTNQIESALETIPRRVSYRGEHISYDVTTYHEGDQSLHFNVSISNTDHLLTVHPVTHILSPGAIVERHRREVHVRSKPTHKATFCHYQGTVNGHPGSRVALSACNGLVSIRNEQFVDKVNYSFKRFRANCRAE